MEQILLVNVSVNLLFTATQQQLLTFETFERQILHYDDEQSASYQLLDDSDSEDPHDLLNEVNFI